MAGRLLRRQKQTEMPPSMSGLGEVPFPHPWLGHWAQRGSSVGMERNLVLQGGGFRDLQGKLDMDLERARTHSWAMITWLPLNFISHLPFYSKMLPKETFLVLCTPRPGLQWPFSQLQQREDIVGLLPFGASATAGEQVSQLDRSQLAQPDTALKGFKPTWLVPKEQQILSMIILPSCLNTDKQNLLTVLWSYSLC